MLNLLIVGDGPVTRAMVPMARALEWTVVVANDMDEVEAGLVVAGAVAVLAHHEAIDAPTLRAALACEIGYIAAMGSQKTQRRRADWLAEHGITDLSRIHTPAGLDIGADTPPEIAISILAELIGVRRGVDSVLSLKGRTTPLHPELAPGEAYCPEG